MGFGSEGCSKWDREREWTYIDVKPFMIAGKIDFVEVYLHESTDSLQIAIFRQASVTSCHFTLVNFRAISYRLPAGYNKVNYHFAIACRDYCCHYKKSGLLWIH